MTGIIDSVMYVAEPYFWHFQYRDKSKEVAWDLFFFAGIRRLPFLKPDTKKNNRNVLVPFQNRVTIVASPSFPAQPTTRITHQRITWRGIVLHTLKVHAGYTQFCSGKRSNEKIS